jgi:hypothetical protein
MPMRGTEHLKKKVVPKKRNYTDLRKTLTVDAESEHMSAYKRNLTESTLNFLAKQYDA